MQDKKFFAITGDLQWIGNYLKARDYSFEFDHIMGDCFYRVFLTLEEYNNLEKEANKNKVNVELMGSSDIYKNRMFGGIFKKLFGK